MNPDLKTHLSNLLNQSITNILPVSGGDISKAYQINTSNNSYFLKVNKVASALEMFQKEANGLRSISQTNTIKTPKFITCNAFENSSFILMEFIESKSPSSEDFKILGNQLADLHKYTSEYFGLNEDNFIGSLPQSNQQSKAWIDFYILERLWPQLKMAKQKQLLSDKEIPTEEALKNGLTPLFFNKKPSLLHGDLWRGNYLISKNGEPYLVDPAIYYGHSEVDIAMSKLFGGFGDAFYQAYHSNLAKDEHTSARMEIYQLYYLLVHLNLFGASYYGSVSTILKKYF
jgi:fructosamine-3-kinase